MTTRKHIAALAICLPAPACTGKAPAHEADTNTTPTPAPQRAGQPVDPIKTAGHIAAARVAAITGNQEGVHRNMEAMTEDLRRAMKLPDAGPAPSFAATGSSTRSASNLKPSRSEERRVGKESVSQCRSRWSTDNKKK